MFIREYRLDLVDSLTGRVLGSYSGSGAGGKFAEERAMQLSLDLTGGRNSHRVAVRSIPIKAAIDDRRYEFSVARVKEDN